MTFWALDIGVCVVLTWTRCVIASSTVWREYSIKLFGLCCGCSSDIHSTIGISHVWSSGGYMPYVLLLWPRCRWRCLFSCNAPITLTTASIPFAFVPAWRGTTLQKRLQLRINNCAFLTFALSSSRDSNPFCHRIVEHTNVLNAACAFYHQSSLVHTLIRCWRCSSELDATSRPFFITRLGQDDRY